MALAFRLIITAVHHTGKILGHKPFDGDAFAHARVLKGAR